MQLEGLNVLLAQDNPTNRLVARQMLESMGAVVVAAGDGTEALDILRRCTFDVLLIDLEMPKLSGLEVIRSITGSPHRGKTPTVIALTAHASPADRDGILAAGAAGVIAKPIVSIDQFGREIAAFVRGLPPARTSGPEQAEMDMDVYRSLAAAVGPQAFGELLGKVDADISAAYDRMERAIAGSDMMELRAATHILIAVAGAVGAVGLQGLSERLNRAAHGEDRAAVSSLGAAAMAETGRVLAFIEREQHS